MVAGIRLGIKLIKPNLTERNANPNSKEINTSILGLGASIASVIFMAGDKREMGEGSQLMIHNALTTQGGNKHELSEAIDRLDSIDAQMSKIYINATGMDEGTVAEMLKNETFMSADEAISKGFATNKTNAMAMVAVYNKQTEAIMPKNHAQIPPNKKYSGESIIFDTSMCMPIVATKI